MGTPDLDPLEVAKPTETRTFEYDDLGRVIKTTQNSRSHYGKAKFGKSRYLGETAEREFKYDGLDRLVKVIFEDDSEMEYFYDQEGNVIETRETASSGSPKVTQFSYYGDNRLYQVTEDPSRPSKRLNPGPERDSTFRPLGPAQDHYRKSWLDHCWVRGSTTSRRPRLSQITTRPPHTRAVARPAPGRRTTVCWRGREISNRQRVSWPCDLEIRRAYGS